MVACATVLAVLARPVVGNADGSSPQQSTNSAGRPSGTLTSPPGQTVENRGKWMPYRPQASAAADQATVAQRVVQTAGWTPVAAGPVRLVQAELNSPLNDPFGDGAPRLRPASSTTSLRDELQEPPVAPATPGSTSPELPTQEPPKQPYVNSLPSQAAPPSPESLLPIPRQANAGEGEVQCPTPRDKDFFKPIAEVTTNIKAQAGDFPRDCLLDRKTTNPHQLRPWGPTTFTWKATGLCHKPLYFEEIQLERYGHSLGPVLQPIVSDAHFFLNVVILPYQMGLEPPCECMYSLGYYRPGSCAPYMFDPIPLSLRAALAEGGVVTGVVALMP